MKKQLSFKAKLISAFLLIGLTPLMIVSVFTYVNSSNSLKDMAKNNLISTREGVSSQIKGLFKSFEHEIRSTASNKTTIDAVDKFNHAFTHFKDETDTSFGTSLE